MNNLKIKRLPEYLREKTLGYALLFHERENRDYWITLWENRNNDRNKAFERIHKNYGRSVQTILKEKFILHYCLVCGVEPTVFYLKFGMSHPRVLVTNNEDIRYCDNCLPYWATEYYTEPHVNVVNNIYLV